MQYFKRSKKQLLGDPEKNAEVIFESVWNTFYENYAAFENRKVDWFELYTLYRPQLTKQTSNDELLIILQNMLSQLNDANVQLITPNKKVFNANVILNQRIDEELFQLDMIKKAYLEKNCIEGKGYLYGKVKNANVGYISFSWIGNNFWALEKALSETTNSKGIIIDFRHSWPRS